MVLVVLVVGLTAFLYQDLGSLRASRASVEEALRVRPECAPAGLPGAVRISPAAVRSRRAMAATVTDECRFTRLLGQSCSGELRLRTARGRARPRAAERRVGAAQARGVSALEASAVSPPPPAPPQQNQSVAQRKRARDETAQPGAGGKQARFQTEVASVLEKKQRGVRGGAGRARPRRRPRAVSGAGLEGAAAPVRESFIALNGGPSDGGLVVGLRAVLRCMDRYTSGAYALQAVALCGRSCPSSFAAVVRAYCAARPHVRLLELSETSPEALGKVLGLASATVVGFRSEVRSEFLAPLSELR